MKGLLSFGFPLLLTVIIPGIVGALIFGPLIVYIGLFVANKLCINAGILGESPLNTGLLFTGLALSIGFLLYFLDDSIYKVFEGYSCWPKVLRKYLTSSLNKKIKKKREKVNRIKKKLEKVRNTEDEVEYRMIWDWLMKFPLKEGSREIETEALLPTRLGNILASYEEYPKSRYGIRAVFFWPRLWLAVDRETRKEINTIWATADCVTYISFVLFGASLLYFLAAIFDFYNIPTLILGSVGEPLNSLAIINRVLTPAFFFGVGIASLIFARLFYLFSLPLHARNGGFFRSLFDLHRDKLEKMTKIRESESEIWDQTWAYLKFGLVKCSKCSQYYHWHLKECPNC